MGDGDELGEGQEGGHRAGRERQVKGGGWASERRERGLGGATEGWLAEGEGVAGCGLGLSWAEEERDERGRFGGKSPAPRARPAGPLRVNRVARPLKVRHVPPPFPSEPLPAHHPASNDGQPVAPSPARRSRRRPVSRAPAPVVRSVSPLPPFHPPLARPPSALAQPVSPRQPTLTLLALPVLSPHLPFRHCRPAQGDRRRPLHLAIHPGPRPAAPPTSVSLLPSFSPYPPLSPSLPFPPRSLPDPPPGDTDSHQEARAGDGAPPARAGRARQPRGVRRRRGWPPAGRGRDARAARVRPPPLLRSALLDCLAPCSLLATARALARPVAVRGCRTATPLAFASRPVVAGLARACRPVR